MSNIHITRIEQLLENLLVKIGKLL